MKTVTQHRPKREKASGKEIAELKRENNQLKKRTSRLQRELQRLDLMVPEEVKEEKRQARKEKRIDTNKGCPNCGTDAPFIQTENPMYFVQICRDCKFVIKTEKELATDQA